MGCLTACELPRPLFVVSVGERVAEELLERPLAVTANFRLPNCNGRAGMTGLSCCLLVFASRALTSPPGGAIGAEETCLTSTDTRESGFISGRERVPERQPQCSHDDRKSKGGEEKGRTSENQTQPREAKLRPDGETQVGCARFHHPSSEEPPITRTHLQRLPRTCADPDGRGERKTKAEARPEGGGEENLW